MAETREVKVRYTINSTSSVMFKGPYCHSECEFLTSLLDDDGYVLFRCDLFSADLGMYRCVDCKSLFGCDWSDEA